MRIKTYYAQTMADALRDVKAELGPDALLLSTKEKTCRSGVRSSMFEIVAAVDDRDEVLSGACAPPEADGTEMEPDSSMPGAGPGPTDGSPAKLSRAASTLYGQLMAGDVDEPLARRLVTESMAALDRRHRRSRSCLLQGMRSVASALMADWDGRDELPRRRVLAFVGPTGVGKTTTIAKLAARLALEKKKRVALITLDGYRIGAVEQLRTYASLIGVPFRFIGSVNDLPGTVEEQGNRDYVLVDTTGRGPRDASAIQELSHLAESGIQMERHLVLSATTKPSDLDDIVARFAPCRPDCLVFTKVDETTTLGPILNQLVRTGKPLSYYTDGQRVPEDLHTLPRERVLDIVFNRP